MENQNHRKTWKQHGHHWKTMRNHGKPWKSPNIILFLKDVLPQIVWYIFSNEHLSTVCYRECNVAIENKQFAITTRIKSQVIEKHENPVQHKCWWLEIIPIIKHVGHIYTTLETANQSKSVISPPTSSSDPCQPVSAGVSLRDSRQTSNKGQNSELILGMKMRKWLVPSPTLAAICSFFRGGSFRWSQNCTTNPSNYHQFGCEGWHFVGCGNALEKKDGKNWRSMWVRTTHCQDKNW